MRALYLAEWLGERGYDPEQVYRDDGYARRAMLREWLREEPQGYDPDKLLSFADDDRPLPVREEADELARVVCLREWLKWVVRERMRVTNLDEQAAKTALRSSSRFPRRRSNARRCTPKWTASPP